MTAILLHSEVPVTLVGGGAGSVGDLRLAQSVAPCVAAADGGAELCLEAGAMPDAVIGDMDSLDPSLATRLPKAHLHQIAEQDSTDFDKALRSISAPLVVGVGFLGKRVDHQLAALNRLVARPEQRIVLLDQTDVVCHAPPNLALSLPLKTRFSLFPLAEVSGRSSGLHWSIDGLDFAPDARVGTSNETSGDVVLDMDAPGMLVILPRQHFRELARALLRAVPWPAPEG